MADPLGLLAPIPALPLDMFRVLAGLLSLSYFLRTLLETSDFSSPGGLIDHRFTQGLFPPTRLSLFRPRMPAWLFRGIFFLACLASLSLALGCWVKPAAAFLFLVAVSTYRWNLLVIYVDDAILHLVLAWVLLLPVGHTLTLPEWLRDGRACIERWSAVTVPGMSTRCFLLNLAIVYVVAGAYKWTSPMWRDGSALYAILKMPIALAPERWQPRHLPFVRLANFAALIVEPFLPLVFVLPAHSIAKWLILAATFAFHLGILATLRIPFANLAMLGATPIILRDEIMQFAFARAPGVTAPAGPWSPSANDALALSLVTALTLMVLLEVRWSGRMTRPPLWKTHLVGFQRNPMYVLLWAVGIAQSYRLFDWIDARNYHVRYDVVETAQDATVRRLDPAELFPPSIRHVLLQSYVHGNIWLQLDGTARGRLRAAILAGYASRYARSRVDSGRIDVFATLQRLTSDNLGLGRGERRLLMRFTGRAGRAVIDDLDSSPAATSAREDASRLRHVAGSLAS